MLIDSTQSFLYGLPPEDKNYEDTKRVLRAEALAEARADARKDWRLQDEE
jgi:hypothetical protein